MDHQRGQLSLRGEYFGLVIWSCIIQEAGEEAGVVKELTWVKARVEI
jgi:hypothetical protein